MSGRPQRSGYTVDGVVTALTEQANAMGLDAVQAGRAASRTIAGEMLGTLVEKKRLDRWFGAPPLPLVEPALAAPHPLPEDFIASFERTAPLRMPGTSKRDTGTYYTPPKLAELVVDQTLDRLAVQGRPVHAVAHCRSRGRRRDLRAHAGPSARPSPCRGRAAGR